MKTYSAGRMLAYLGLFQILALVYFPSLSGEFIYDDVPSIVENKDLRGSPAEVFRAHENSLQFDRRPVGGILTWLNFRVSGLSPVGYRLTNLVLHWATAIAVAELFVALASVAGLGVSVGPIVGILWALHPLNSMAVCYIYQRMEQLMALFFLVSLLAILKANRGRAWLAVAWVSAVLSLLSKEAAVLLPFAMLFAERLVSFRSWKELAAKRWGFYASLFAVWVALGIWFLGGTRVDELSIDDPLSSPLGYLKSQCREVLNYFKLLVYPSPLVFYRAPAFPGTLPTYLPQAAALMFMGAVTVGLGRRYRWFGVAAIAGGVALAPTSTIIPIPLEPAAEFRMYFPSAMVLGVITMLAFVLFKDRGAGRFYCRLAIVLLATVSAFLSHERAKSYRSAEAIWADTVSKQPWNAKAWANLGTALVARKEFDGALRCADAIDSLDQIHGFGVGRWSASIRAFVFLGTKRWGEAERAFRLLLDEDPTDPFHLYGLAASLFEQGKHSEAAEQVSRSLALMPGFGRSRELEQRITREIQAMGE